MGASKTQTGGEMYVAPQVEMVNVAVEKGFAASGEHKTEFTGGDVEDMDL